jgi:mono/diheme cytochrome c family protein
MAAAARPRLHIETACVVIVLLFASFARPNAALGQDEAKVNSGLEVWRSSGCADCHGPFADGNRADDDAPMGANLRATKLDAAALRQTISCGRPGADMPSFDEGAYVTHACAGRPLGDPPDNLYPAPTKISPDQIDAVVAYLQARIIGRGDITKRECLAYYEGDPSGLCEDYKQ